MQLFLMPRCQWCRQESATADVCEWCKRPLAPAWTPGIAAPAAVAAAPLPHDRMTFVQDDAAGKNDRILVFAMLGIVVVTAIAFAVNYFSKKDLAPPPAVQAAVSAPQQVAQDPANPAPTPAVTPTPDQGSAAYQPAAQPMVQQPQYEDVPPPASTDFNRGAGMQNSKLRGLAHVTDQG